MKRSWKSSYLAAIRTNPRLSVTLAIEFGLLSWAAWRARRYEPAVAPPTQAVFDALPYVMAAAALAPLLRKR
jgi:hypothetical protein